MRSGLLIENVIFACRTQCAGLLAVAVAVGSFTSFANAEEVTPYLGTPEPIETAKPLTSAPRFGSVPQARMETQQRYQRTNNNTGLKNYYSELFAKPGASQTQLRGASTPARTSTPKPSRITIYNAGYQSQKNGNTNKTILPVSAAEKEAQTSNLPEWARNARQKKPQATTNRVPANNTLQPPVPKSSSLPVATMKIDRQPSQPSSGQLPQQAHQVHLGNITAGSQNPSVKIEWKSLTDINVGQESECELIVSNLGDSTAYGVRVEANFPSMVRLLETTPKPNVTVASTSWNLGDLKQGQTKKITIKLLPTRRGSLAATARVHFTGAAQSAFVVREPLIDVSIKGLATAMVGDPASQSVTISNPGNGIAKNVRIEAIIPTGLEHPRGEKLLMDVGSLNPGETRTIRLALVALEGGNQTIKVTATAAGDLLKTAEASVKITAPSLQAKISGPGLRYKGRTASYTISVKNDGTVGTSNVRLMHKVPEGFEFVSASKGATFDAPTRILSWFVGRLDARKSAEMKVKLKAVKIGEFVHYIRTTSEHGSSTDSQLITRVEGSASLSLEITDLDDPVEVGNETAYQIVVKNEGSADAKNVGISCELPAGVQFVSATGATKHSINGNFVVFEPVINVGVGKSTTFRVHVVGSTEGNLRFRARMTSATSQEPLTFEELTRFYGDEN